MPAFDEAGAAALARRLRRVMALPFQVGATEVVIGASVGIAASQPDSTVDSLLRSADTQMYLDKSRPVATVLPD